MILSGGHNLKTKLATLSGFIVTGQSMKGKNRTIEGLFQPVFPGKRSQNDDVMRREILTKRQIVLRLKENKCPVHARNAYRGYMISMFIFFFTDLSTCSEFKWFIDKV